MESIGESGALLLFAAPERTRSNDTLYRYRQDSDFYYLTRFPEPEAILLLLPGHETNEFTLFTRPRDPEREIWDGFRFGPEGAKERFGADEAYNVDAFEQKLTELLTGRETLHYRYGDDTTRDLRVFNLLKKLNGAGRRADRGPRTIVDSRPQLHSMRRIKSREELEQLRGAAEVSAHAHLVAMRTAYPGMMEYELQANIEHEMARLGASGPAYASIVAGGSNACVLHYIENREQLRDGELVLIDAGAEVNGYAGDITRTFPIGSSFSSAQRDVYDAVLEVEKDAISRVRPGVSWHEHHAETRRQLCRAMVSLGLLKGSTDALIKENRDRAFFMHGTGHYLGIDVHDVGPYATFDRGNGEDVPLPFEEGVVLTIEPGIYIAADNEDVPAELRGIGIRIEDDVIVTAKGPENITSQVPKERSAIEELRAESLEQTRAEA